MSDRQRNEFRLYESLLHRLVRCLPGRSYRIYGDELMQVYSDALREAFAQSGMTAVRSRMPELLADLVAALCLEYVDAWRCARLSPPRLAVSALVAAGLVWCLTAIATVGRTDWAAAVLEYNLALTVTLMLGLPALSLVASRIGGGWGAGESKERSVQGVSIAATAVAWTILTCHIAA